jgi:hypothetical protein|tara:strand:+ start:30 stop:917 length:888 start_codon:yes stop_codon:yes gene_type:complete
MSNENEMLNTEQSVDPLTTASVPTGDDDIFKEVFGVDTDQFVAKVGEEVQETSTNEPSEVSDVSNPKESPDQFQYWQSQADKKAAEVEALKKEVEALKSKETSAPEQPQPAVESQEIVRPIKPVRPSGFDNSEALTDPDSKSAKYLAAKEQYLDDMTEYLMSQEEKRNQLTEQQLAQQQKLQSQNQLLSDLQTGYGYTPEEANDFLDKMSKPESLSLDNLVKLHKSLSSRESENIPMTQPNVIDPRQSEMAQRQQKLAIPKPITTQAGASKQSSKSIEDQMMDSMVANYKKKNPF